jgi:cytochrome P450
MHQIVVNREGQNMTQLDEIQYDPFSPAVMNDPHSFYRKLRAEAPVYYVPEWDLFAVSRFQDVWDVLGNPDGAFLATETTMPGPLKLQFHNDGAVPDPPTNPMMAPYNVFGSPIFEQFRQIPGKELRPGAVGRLTEYVRELTRTRINELVKQRDFNLTRDYGGYVSSNVMCHLLGIPSEQALFILDLINSVTLTNSPETRGGLNFTHLVEETMRVLIPAVHNRREEGSDGGVPMVDNFINFEFEGRKLTDEELAVQFISILVGGTETVPKIAAHGLWELQKDPSQLAAVRTDLETNVRIASEEMIRYCAPAQWFMRTVRKPVNVAGTDIKPGQRVIPLLGSASRDEREFPNPDEFIWNREIPRTLSFGRGQRFCLGVHLARLEINILLEEFLSAVSEYEVDSTNAMRPASSFQWGWNELPVSVRA